MLSYLRVRSIAHLSEGPNAGRQLLPKAGATKERTL